MTAMTILWLLEKLENMELREDVETLTPLARAGIEYNVLLTQGFPDDDGYELTRSGYEQLARDVTREAA
jgi:hypothetical protein